MSHYNFTPLRQRFAANVAKDSESGCWEWQGALNQSGYGRIRTGGRTQEMVHRVSYELHRGPIPEGLVIDHQCFNRACVNPAHLRPVTPLQNSRNRRAKPGIRVRDECINGHTMTAENTYFMPSGFRDCRACIRVRVRRYQARKAAAS